MESTGVTGQSQQVDGASAPDVEAASAPGVVSADHPGIVSLFGVLAYGEISAFYRLVEDAAMAPTLRDRIAMASMAAAEMNHFEVLEAALRERGRDVLSVTEPFAAALDAYHASTLPSTWMEVLVKTYVADGLAADFYREIAHSLPAEVAATVREVLAETGHSEFVVSEVAARVAEDAAAKDRLMLWGRRLLGEAITQAQFVLAQREELTELVMTASGDFTGIVALFDRMQVRHSERMATLGLV
ncbi:ferritin-like fold-containing protein [Rhodococcoides corynebacterioides]|uniref:ferritin-like fold-containing protein n=1 Tax=Rhodococcoides corynebacterioides TaxID=53972 RepID=UPI00082DA855|nr:ferritin-like fold-containing protein [Rhodococcus corynebacterioides]MBY6363797.1 hydroxylase [Rhodococcus corynebacterioides]